MIDKIESMYLNGLVVSNSVKNKGITINSKSGYLYSLKIIFPIQKILGHLYLFVPVFYYGQIVMKSINRYIGFKSSICDIIHRIVWDKRILRESDFNDEDWMPKRAW